MGAGVEFHVAVIDCVSKFGRRERAALYGLGVSLLTCTVRIG